MNLTDVLTRTGFIQPDVCPGIPTFKFKETDPRLYIDDKKFFDRVLRQAVSIKAITYTATASIVDSLPIELLVTNRLQGVLQRPIEVVHIKNVHSKVYYLTKNHGRSIWIGSMNLVTPGGWHNVMLKLPKELHREMDAYLHNLLFLQTVSLKTPE